MIIEYLFNKYINSLIMIKMYSKEPLENSTLLHKHNIGIDLIFIKMLAVALSFS